MTYDRIFIPKRLLSKYNFANDTLKNRNQKEGIGFVRVTITEIKETPLSKARQTQPSRTKVAMVCLLLASLTSLYINHLKGLTTTFLIHE